MDNIFKRFSRELRRDATKAETVFWNKVRDRQLAGAKFKRQFAMGAYIVDFVCFEQKLIVEIDGGQHNESASDEARDAFFTLQGFRILRFWNNEVLNNIEGVLWAVQDYLSFPSPLVGEGQGEGMRAQGAPFDKCTAKPCYPSSQPSPTRGEGDSFVGEVTCLK